MVVYFLALAISLIASAITLNNEFNPIHNEIIATPTSYQNKQYKVTKNKEVFEVSNNTTAPYPYKIDKIEYNSIITEPQVEVTTFKHYGGVKQFSWKFGEHNISYRTRITKLTLPEKALTEEFNLAKTIIAGPISSK